jgi:hypothetical protein
VNALFTAPFRLAFIGCDWQLKTEKQRLEHAEHRAKASDTK